MKKKVLAALLCVAMVASMAVGCGGKSGDSGSTATESQTAKKSMDVDGDYTELNVWTFIEMHQDFYMNMAENGMKKTQTRK